MLKLAKKTALTAVALLLSYSAAAYACRFTSPLSPEMEAAAQSVFQGRLVAYDVLTLPMRVARLKFVSTKSIRGERKKEWEVYWTNDMFGLPEPGSQFAPSPGTSFEVGVVIQNRDPWYPQGIQNFAGTMLEGKPRIVQGNCTKPYLKVLTSGKLEYMPFP